MDYRLENLSDDEFEHMINSICQKILGTGVVSFSKGRDGGRDGRFEGKANEFPSKVESWSGKFIIQAKHTSDYNASCSDKAFYGNQKSIINSEIEKIKVLVSKKEVDNYLLFTNRKETESRENAVNYIKSETGAPNVAIIGKETLHRFIAQNREILKQFRLDSFTMPFILTDSDIKEVIVAFGNQIKNVKDLKSITNQNLLAISKIEKNLKNELTEDYYQAQIKGRSLQFFAQIDDFLQQDANEEFTEIYHNFASELSNKIDIKRADFTNFEEIFLYLFEIIFKENASELKRDKRFIWIFLHHLYFNCHIGKL
jgi:hypothetical protein